LLAAALFLRLWIATYNTDANDTHLEVIQRIMDTGRMPVVDDCWQCYHVKGFHYPAAVALARLAIHDPITQLLVLQYGNVLLGMLTLLLIWAWLSRSALAEGWKLLLFALFALNPRLAAINTQVTNDSLVIFAATACFFLYARFLERGGFGSLWAALLLCGLALATKASGIVVAALLLGHLLLLGLHNLRGLGARAGPVAVTVLLIAGLAAAVPYSGYLQNYRQAGTPLANNIEKFPFPNWTQDKRWSNAGTTSIVNTYLTFRWPGLVAYPFATNGPALYPEHRTSHWAQVYARHSFARFERWPPSWSTSGWWTMRVGQAAMVLGLVPLALLLIGIGALTRRAAGAAARARSLRPVITDPEVFLGLSFLAMVAMSLKLSIDYQTWKIMKAIYMYPGLIGAAVLTALGLAAVLPRLGAAGRWTAGALLAALAAVHTADLAILATDLQARYPERVQALAAYAPDPAEDPGQVRLDELAPASVNQPAGGPGINASFSGAELTGGHRKYRYGFGTHALSRIAFDLDGEYRTFETRMALADEAASADGVVFEIIGDDELLYRGPRLVEHQVDHARVDVEGVERLTLRVQPLGNSQGDLANWLNPVLTRAQ